MHRAVEKIGPAPRSRHNRHKASLGSFREGEVGDRSTGERPRATDPKPVRSGGLCQLRRRTQPSVTAREPGQPSRRDKRGRWVRFWRGGRRGPIALITLKFVNLLIIDGCADFFGGLRTATAREPGKTPIWEHEPGSWRRRKRRGVGGFGERNQEGARGCGSRSGRNAVPRRRNDRRRFVGVGKSSERPDAAKNPCRRTQGRSDNVDVGRDDRPRPGMAGTWPPRTQVGRVQGWTAAEGPKGPGIGPSCSDSFSTHPQRAPSTRGAVGSSAHRASFAPGGTVATGRRPARAPFGEAQDQRAAAGPFFRPRSRIEPPLSLYLAPIPTRSRVPSGSPFSQKKS